MTSQSLPDCWVKRPEPDSQPGLDSNQALWFSGFHSILVRGCTAVADGGCLTYLEAWMVSWGRKWTVERFGGLWASRVFVNPPPTTNLRLAFRMCPPRKGTLE